MTLSDWDEKIKPHLNYIEAGADMAARHTRALICRPDFACRAQDELATTRRVLESALQSIIAAQNGFEAKARESDRAA